MRKLENKKVDEIGKALVKASAMPAREIDVIVADRALFDSVRKRIASNTEVAKTPRSWVLPSLKAVSASVVLMAIVSALFVFRSNTDEVAERRVPQPQAPPAKRFTEPDRVVNNMGDLPAPMPVSRPEKISSRTITKVNRPKQPAAQNAGSGGDFYALSYAGDPNETERGGRIVRVDIPRTTLFAMGIDVPLENEVDTVKADLLVGNDGVTRAIRVVK